MLCHFATESELLEAFTVEEAVNKMGFGVFQLIVALLAGFVWVRVCKVLLNDTLMHTYVLPYIYVRKSLDVSKCINTKL